VPSMATQQGGTSAGLMTGDLITINDLLHGMMLPSGNDAAYTLAYYVGRKQYLRNIICKKKIVSNSPLSSTKSGVYLNKFISMMNKMAKRLGLRNTTYHNPHGL